MNTTLGLFPQAKKYPGICDHELEMLRSVGFDEEQLHLISDEAALSHLVKDARQTVIFRYAAIGAVGLTLAYVLLGLCAGACGFNPFAWGKTLATALLSLGELFLVTLGIVLGAVIGERMYERDADLFVRAVHQGARVILVRAGRADSRKAKRILEHGGASSVLQF